MYSESLDTFRFPQSQIEGETVALLAKKYATTHVDAVVAVGAAAFDFAEKHRGRLWPDTRVLFQLVPVEKLGQPILANAGAAEALLRRGNASDDELGSIIAAIKKAALRASEVIRRVRALVTSRQSERKAEDLNSIISDVLAFLRGEADRRGVVIDTAFDPELPCLEIDRVQLQQAIANLCINAMDAMAETAQGRRRLAVRTAARDDGSIEIIVTDTGPGISAEQMPRLFESFFTTKAEGMGLGLSIARSIVEAHDGTLSAENLDPGGALFRVVLAASRAVTTPLEAPQQSVAVPDAMPSAPTASQSGSPRAFRSCTSWTMTMRCALPSCACFAPKATRCALTSWRGIFCWRRRRTARDAWSWICKCRGLAGLTCSRHCSGTRRLCRSRSLPAGGILPRACAP